MKALTVTEVSTRRMMDVSSVFVATGIHDSHHNTLWPIYQFQCFITSLSQTLFEMYESGRPRSMILGVRTHSQETMECVGGGLYDFAESSALWLTFRAAVWNRKKLWRGGAPCWHGAHTFIPSLCPARDSLYTKAWKARKCHTHWQISGHEQIRTFATVVFILWNLRSKLVRCTEKGQCFQHGDLLPVSLCWQLVATPCFLPWAPTLITLYVDRFPQSFPSLWQPLNWPCLECVVSLPRTSSGSTCLILRIPQQHVHVLSFCQRAGKSHASSAGKRNKCPGSVIS